MIPTLTEIISYGDQTVVFGVILIAFALFAWGKWRYDMVALFALLLVVFGGVFSTEAAFQGFTHPAVIIVISMFVIGRGVVESGVIETVIRKTTNKYVEHHPVLQLFILVLIVTIASAFVNNVGALAFMIPIGVRLARRSNTSPAMFLIPLAFGSHLGGFLTLIGSPRNIIVSTFRENAVGAPFTMFEFAYVGIGIAIVGIAFLSFVGWRLIPRQRKGRVEAEAFELENYLTEVRVGPDSVAIGKTLRELKDTVESKVIVTTLMRGDHRVVHPSDFTTLKESDVLLIQDDSEALTQLIEANKLTLVGNKAVEEGASQADEMKDVEVVVASDSALEGKSWKEIGLRMRYGVNLLAVAREGAQLKEHLDDITFQAGDILLLRGREETLEESIQRLGCLPLADRKLSFGRTPQVWGTLLIFGITILLASVHIFPVHLLFLTAALAMVALNIVNLDEAYDSIDWPVIMLLGAMITVGLALRESGGAETLSDLLIQMQTVISPEMMLVAVLFVTTLLSDFVNSNAAAVIMAPIAISLAAGIGASIDPFLMAVAIGSNVAFLTPYGHESNALVMEAGGYKFKDYVRTGLPLEILILATSVPLILYFWPLF